MKYDRRNDMTFNLLHFAQINYDRIRSLVYLFIYSLFSFI